MLYEQPRTYDALYDRFVEDIPFYRDLAGELGGPVCEPACGSGRVAVPLAEAGFDVVGYDRSEEMVAAARRRARAAGVADRTKFIAGDMRSPVERGGFGLVVVALHSLEHLHGVADVVTALTAARRVLRSHGRCALALHNPSPAVLSAEPEDVRRVFPELSEPIVYERTSYRCDAQVLNIEWFIEREEETQRIAYELRMIFPLELEALLSLAGFTVEQRYGWYDRTPFTSESGTQIVVAAPRADEAPKPGAS